MINYANQEVHFTGCPGCAYARHEFELPCGMAYENDRFTLSQDWELPIPGFFIVTPKRCIDTLSELTKEERDEMFEITDRTIKILRENKNISQTALGKAVNMTQRKVSYIECGKYEPNIDDIIALCSSVTSLEPLE